MPGKRSGRALDDRAVEILVDHRERASRVYPLLASAPGIDVRVGRLEVGDYLLDGRVLVERKTLDDFAASIVDTRLFRQASRLVRSPHRGVVVVEGRAADRRPRLGREQLQGALVTLVLIFGLPVLRSATPEETVWLLRTVSRQAARKIAKGIASRRWNPRDADARRVHMLTALPNIGPERAARLLERFGTLERVLGASAEELASLPGIGPETAARIRAFLEKDH
jgi:ERCC4-type nuclease